VYCHVIPCLYVFVEIRVDVQHLLDCVKLTFLEEERRRDEGRGGEEKDGTSCCGPTKIIEALVMGTVQFRTAVSKSAQRMDGSSTVPTGSTTDQVHVQAIVPQAKPLSPGEVMGCTHYYDSNKDRNVMSHGS